MIQTLRAGFGMPTPLGSFSASASTFVPLPSLEANRGIWAYVLPPVAMSASMRMYSAKQRASLPLSTVSPATEQVGSATPVRPASFASAAIPAGVMCGVPLTCSRPSALRTVERPSRPCTTAAAPKTMRINAAVTPASVRVRLRGAFFMELPLRWVGVREPRAAADRDPHHAFRAQAGTSGGIALTLRTRGTVGS